MNGPEHYREAERLRSAALNVHTADTEGFTGWQRDDLLALAQVHATLALAAATAQVMTEGGKFMDYVLWPREVIA